MAFWCVFSKRENKEEEMADFSLGLAFSSITTNHCSKIVLSNCTQLNVNSGEAGTYRKPIIWHELVRAVNLNYDGRWACFQRPQTEHAV